jgi:capsular exopolysaccharide synthesis family protein
MKVASDVAGKPDRPAAPAKLSDVHQLSYELSGDLVTLNEGRAMEAEAIRTMRTHVMTRHVEDGRRGLVICAPTEGVGGSYVAANLAASLAQVGVNTLLIDADLRSPSVEHFIRPTVATEGLAQCLAAPDSHPSSFVHQDVLPNLSVLFSGGVAENPQELLSGDAFKNLIDRCLRDYEFTVVDSPPANTCADARRISAVVGYAVIVAKRDVSYYADVQTLASQFTEDGAKVVGTVLNEVRSWR